MSAACSSRWCPKPEQVKILQGIYKGGIKTPNTAQIHQITEKLSMYGKVEGKNVFYWFQNHKARDRQKLRKMLMSKQLEQKQKFTYNMDFASSEMKNDKMKIERLQEMDQKAMVVRVDGNDWMMMMVTGVNENSTSCCRQPELKTLELFPLTATNVKEELKIPSENPNLSALPSLTFSLGLL